MIHFENWNIEADGEILARQFDNKTRTLTVVGDIPSGWEWTMLVQVDGAMDILSLEAAEDGLSIVLTAEQLSIAGYYLMQLRGTQGELVQHTNTVTVYIPASLSGDAQWPTVPSEFTEMENRVRGYAEHPPTIGENGNWYLWDGKQYVDSGYIAEPKTDETLTIPGEPADAAETGAKLERRAQGVLSSVTILSPGWKRVAVLTRGSSGFASISCGVNGQFGRTAQSFMVGYSGFVSLPGFDEDKKARSCDPCGHPRLWQMVSHVRGENANTTDPERLFRVDKVRLCYPKNRSEVDREIVGEDAWDEYNNPVHIYFDVHVVCDPAFDWSTIKPPPWGQLSLSTSITGLTNSNRIRPINEEQTVEDENPTGFSGVVCETYELELENDTQLNVPGYSKMEELAVDKLYTTKRVEYELNGGAVIPGRMGSVRLLELNVSEQGVPFYVQAVGENMLVDHTPTNKSTTQAMSVKRYANGIYEAHCGADDGITAAATYIPIYEQFPCKADKAPIVLKAGVRYVANDVWLHVIPYDRYEEIRDDTNKMPANKEMTSVHGTDAERYGHGQTVIEAVDYDRVVARASIYFKKGGSYEGRCFYPQLCREGVEVVNPALTADDPLSLVTRPVPYTPKPTELADHNDKSYYRIRGMSHARELRVFADGYSGISGTATLEAAVDFAEAVLEAIPSAEGVAY